MRRTDCKVQVSLELLFPGENFVPCNWLITLPQDVLMERVGALAADKLTEVDSLLRRAGLDINLA